jgi:L-gulonate 5-dehydrogenase
MQSSFRPATRRKWLGEQSEQQHHPPPENRKVGSRLNRRLIPQVVTWLAEGRLNPESMITQVFAGSSPAAAAREAIDLIEKQPQGTLKVLLDFS